MTQVPCAGQRRVSIRLLLAFAWVGAVSLMVFPPIGSQATDDCPAGVVSSPGLPPSPGVSESPGLGDSQSPVPDCLSTTTSSSTTSSSTTSSTSSTTTSTTTTTTTTTVPSFEISFPSTTVPEPPTTEPPAVEPDIVIELPFTDDPVPPPTTTTTTTVKRERVAALPTTTTTSTTVAFAEVLGETLERPAPAPKPRPQPAAAPSTPDDRPDFVTALPDPDTISWSPKHIANNAWIAFLLVLLLGLPAEIFNSSIKARQQNKPHAKRRGRLHALEERINHLPDGILLIAFGLLSALIYAELDPHLGFNRRSLLLVGALMAALVIVTALSEAIRIPYLRRRHSVRAHLQMFPRALVIAVPLVILSRLTNFHPGFIFGVTCAVAVEDSLRDEDEGQSLALVCVAILALGAFAWVFWIPASHAANVANPSGIAVLLDTFLATLWVTGLQVVLFGLLPLKYLYGEKVVQWSRVGWFAIYFTAALMFTQVLLHPASGSWGGFSEHALRLIAGVGCVLLAASCTYWLWVRAQLKSLGATPAPIPAEEAALA